MNERALTPHSTSLLLIFFPCLKHSQKKLSASEKLDFPKCLRPPPTPPPPITLILFTNHLVIDFIFGYAVEAPENADGDGMGVHDSGLNSTTKHVVVLITVVFLVLDPFKRGLYRRRWLGGSASGNGAKRTDSWWMSPSGSEGRRRSGDRTLRG